MSVKPTQAGLRERKKAKTMASIQLHALQLFRQYGYKATTVEQIAEAAEISYSTFFRYFSTKEDVLLIDNYDPLLVASFESQPAHLTPLMALRNAMLSGAKEMTPQELSTMRERNELVMSVPELRAAMINNMVNMMDLIIELTCRRTGREREDLAVRAFAGAVIGVNISVMQYYAEHPEADFLALLEEALNKLEAGLPL
ncbi:TetR family transcriptional regulator [Paenibacillus riograndensis SBR5]|uniref:TetR family transcriptional regulator n=2 Tax=Paenibacillus riograndensis TaxID=483937 RepID=A0A0E4CZU0_9BACL|nr:TetR family transcriptional regulator [Paenibacillus riograndensis SBR5]